MDVHTEDRKYDYWDGPDSEEGGKKNADNVNHPSHYENSCSLECIDVMEACFGSEAVFYFCVCNAFKYLWRYKNKNGTEDLRKAQWYLNRADWINENRLGKLWTDDFNRAQKLYISELRKMANDLKEKTKND